MGIFKKNKNKLKQKEMAKETAEEIVVIDRPRICCLDLNKDTVDVLRKSGANIYCGTLGAKIKVPNNTVREYHQLLLNFDFPSNLHEYDIIILDLENFEIKDYKSEDHKRENHTGKTSLSLLCSYPETLFDPRPFSSHLLRAYLHKITNRKFLVLAFSSEAYEVEYEPIETTESHFERQGIEKYNIYSFWNYIPISETKNGKEIFVRKMKEDLQSLLEKYKNGASYSQTFHHPTKWNKGQNVEDDKYFPLMTNLNGDIISFIETSENENLIILPQIKDKANFIMDFLSKIAPSIYPELFPYSTTFNWKNQEEYFLPKHSTLLEGKTKVSNEYEKKLGECERRIEENLERYSYLHKIITETGDDLVDALVKYLKWLEWDNVERVDKIKSSSGALEEDIQITQPDKLLIIECKGIGGTSTDADCSQISKIKHRRCKERGKFDVFALYIVNHQRYLPPLKRQNPPFTETQIQDAKNDERGLLTTWQLFNLFFDIENGIISKEEARQLFFEFGFVEFRPRDIHYVYEPTEFFNKGTVCIVNINNITLGINDELLVEKNGKFTKIIILDIQENDKAITQASNGELGLKLSSKIERKSKLWKKGSH
jgi:hypothetical protein